MAERKIRNVQQLADQLDCNPTEASISRRIYKATDCGAWVSLSHVSVTKTERQVWTAQFRPSVCGPWLGWLARGRGPRLDPRYDPIDRQVLDYFLLPEPRRDGSQSVVPWNYSAGRSYTMAEFRELLEGSEPGMHGCISYSPRTMRYKVAIDVTRVVKELPCVHIGSIVEGVDQSTAVQELIFPFTMDQFWSAVQEVEDEAKSIWDDTHGCDTCLAHWLDGGFVYGVDLEIGSCPVWEDCPDCGGDGTVI